MSENLKRFLLIFILVLAGFLRFNNLSSIPPSLNWDEAALGYNAYSLGIDGKDEFGNFLPVQYLESFGDFKPVVYSYLATVPVKVFGLNEFGVRFPSAFFGILTVALTYFLVKEIFPKKDKKTEHIALFSTFIMAISPWHIMLSRGAYEANVSTLFIVLGVFLFLKAVNKNMWYLVPSAASFALTFYTFNTARVFVPLFIISLAIVFGKKLIKDWKKTVVAGFLGLALLLPLIPFLVSPQAKLRYHEVNIFSDISIIEKSNQYIANDNNAPWSRVIHNRRVLYSIEFAKHYLDNFNPRFLFITGDGNPRFSTQDVGQLYLISLPFLISGIFLLIRRREGHFWILPLWLLLGIIPAATARETPHALRIESVIPTLQIITAYGIVILTDFIKNKRIQKIFFGTYILFAFIFLFYFFHGLLFHYSREYSGEWQYPYIESVKFVEEEKNNFEKVMFTQELGRPYIYFLVYGDKNPKRLRDSSDIEREVFGFVHVNRLGNINFSKNINKMTPQENILYLDVPINVPVGAKIIKKFYYLNGEEALIAYVKE